LKAVKKKNKFGIGKERKILIRNIIIIIIEVKIKNKKRKSNKFTKSIRNSKNNFSY
jgi:hypothetical protein